MGPLTVKSAVEAAVMTPSLVNTVAPMVMTCCEGIASEGSGVTPEGNGLVA
jgi:hypothetical protein